MNIKEKNTENRPLCSRQVPLCGHHRSLRNRENDLRRSATFFQIF